MLTRLTLDGKPLTLVIVFDEARQLVTTDSLVHDQTVGDSSISLFRLLRRALRLIPGGTNSFNVIAMFLDTASRIANFLPADSRDPSLRYGKMPTRLMAPMFQIPWWDRDLPLYKSSQGTLTRLFSHQHG